MLAFQDEVHFAVINNNIFTVCSHKSFVKITKLILKNHNPCTGQTDE